MGKPHKTHGEVKQSQIHTCQEKNSLEGFSRWKGWPSPEGLIRWRKTCRENGASSLPSHLVRRAAAPRWFSLRHRQASSTCNSISCCVFVDFVKRHEGRQQSACVCSPRGRKCVCVFICYLLGTVSGVSVQIRENWGGEASEANKISLWVNCQISWT